ncbi:MAG: hypothetical protein JRN06_03045 [Nitrososphaerota archaeon]|nr:hypothetical protein [Nitrososphaerota archaeon]MDG7023165.1 hypothetical protein [Nitrososphaerota archaeon]
MSSPPSKVKLDNKARVIESVKSGLASAGVDSKVVLHLLAVKHGIKPEQIPERPAQFAHALAVMFGTGSKQVILAIMRELLVCSYEGVEFSPLAIALTEGLGSQASLISPKKIAEEREIAERRDEAGLGPVKPVTRPSTSANSQEPDEGRSDSVL